MTIKDSKEAYGTAFEPLLKSLRMSRIKVWIGIMMCIVSTVLTLMAMGKNSGFFVIIVYLLITAAIGLQTWYTYQIFRQQFKTRVVKAVLHFIDPEYKYFYEHHHSLSYFLASGLYVHRPDKIKGEDFVSGEVDGYHFEMSEIEVFSSESSDENKRFFKGLFIQVDWPFELYSGTYLFPGKPDQPLTDFFRDKSLKKKSLKVLIEDSAFSESYTVYGDSPDETRALLTTELKEALVKFDKRFFSDTYISFVGKKAYCAVAYESRLFEPTLWDPGAFPSTIMDLYRQVTIVNKFLEAAWLLVPPEEETTFDSAAPVETASKTATLPAGTESIQEIPKEAEAASELQPEATTTPEVRVNLKELYYDMVIDQEYPSELSLKQYLLALIGNIEKVSDQVLTQSLLKELFTKSLEPHSKDMEPAWLELRSAPDPKIKYQQVSDVSELDESLDASDFEWRPLEFTLAVLQFQVAELHKMTGKQLENPMKELSIASDTGTHWYNFAPKDNLEAGIQYMIDTHGTYSNLNWSVIGQIFQAGRAYE